MTLVILDAGHGGYDPGADGYGLIEKNLTLDLTLRVAQQLRCESNLDVRLTREDDTFLELSERADVANQAGADYFVSLHHNAGGGNGFESYVYPGTSDDATGQKRHAVHEVMVSFLSQYDVPDRGEKEANFAVLRETKMSAVLLENLFLDSPKDADLLKKPDFLQGLSEAIASGIKSALK